MEGSAWMLRRAAARTAVGGRIDRGIRRAVAALTGLVCVGVLAAPAAAETTTYSAIETIPVPPASNFAGSGGGDGWAVALSSEAVYNVFHHNGVLTVACHKQSDASPCYSPETITDQSGNNFSTSGHPGLYLDQKTGKLYVYATRTSDSTGGVVCFDTMLAATNPNPFCGFTELTGKGEAPIPGYSAMSDPVLIGTHLYSFNNADGKVEGTKDQLTCFDVSTDAACAGQPFAVSLGAGEVTTGLPPGPTAAIAGKVIVPIQIAGESWLACFDNATQKSCGGKWPVKLTFSYTFNGAPFPLMDATGKTIGLCLPTGTDQCFNLEGEATATPAGMSAVVGASDGWNGPALVLGPRVYLPNGNAEEGIGEVECFDYSTGAGCANFPKKFTELDYLYTVNADPQRPTCIWVNSDHGANQIQNFDAYTGKECGQGTIRVLASQFVVPQPQCTPASYVSLQILKPPRNTYASGSVAFDDGDGNPILGLEERTLDETGTASLAGLELNTPTGLPQFLFTLNGEQEKIGVVEVKLTWLADYNKTCIGEHTQATEPKQEPKPEPKPEPKATPAPKPTPTTVTPSPPTPKIAVLAFGSAHLASSPKACVAGGDYLASVSGKHITSVTFTLGGHKLKTLGKANSHGAFVLLVPVKAGRVEHLTIHVAFDSSTRNRSQTITKTLARCAAAPHVVKPRFTG
jgi:hypothetical protein